MIACSQGFYGSSSLQEILPMKRVHPDQVKTPCFIQGRIPTNARTSGKGIRGISSLFNISRLTLERNPVSTTSVTKSFSTEHTSFDALHAKEKPNEGSECGEAFTCHSAFVQHKIMHAREKPFGYRECRKAFCDSSSLAYYTRRTPRSPLRALSVARPLSMGHISCDTSTFTLEKSPMAARTDPPSNTIPSTLGKSHTGIRCEKAFEDRSHLTQHRWIGINLQINPVSTKNVGRPSPTASIFSCIPTHTGEKPFEAREGRRATRNHTGEEPEEHMVLESIWP
uniref:zinc finger protein 429-like n=1 Tax=Halichoerus grypus TaxID=9711 RepID=UPI0016598EFB|nr:zinc finger protein 429-like [Halichoerus grypus]